MKYAYNTSAINHYHVKKMALAIQKETASGVNSARSGVTSHFVKDGKDYYISGMVLGITGYAIEVPAFGHPLTIESFDHEWKSDYSTNTFIDARPFTTEGRDGLVYIGNFDDFSVQCMRASLEALGHQQGISALTDFGNFPMVVYMRWLSDLIARTLQLDAAAQVRTEVIAAAFYFSLFEAEKRVGAFSDRVKSRIAMTIAKSTFIDAENALKILDVLPAMNNIDDFIEVLKKHGDSIRFDNFNRSILLTIVSRSWYSDSTGEMAAVALEHPATLFAMIYAALNMRGYKKAPFTQAVEQVSRKGDSESWSRSIQKANLGLVHR